MVALNVAVLSQSDIFTQSVFDFNKMAEEGISISKPNGVLVGVNLPCEAEVEYVVDAGEEENLEPTREATSTSEDELLELEDMYHSPDTTVPAPDSHVTFDGQNVHKASVVRIVFSSNPRSSESLKRVRGFTKFSGNCTHKSPESESYLHIADPFCCLSMHS